MTDKTGDGFLGSNNYYRGHITFKRNLLGNALTVIAVLGMAFVISVIVGAIFYSKPAQSVLQDVIGGSNSLRSVEHIRNTQ